MNPPSVATISSRRTRAVEGCGGRGRRIAAALLTLATIGAAAPVAYPPDSVLLLVAPWCAPCHAELARLDAIAAAARPLAVRVFAVEDNVRARAMLRGVPEARRWSPPEGEARRARADALARAPGLPFSLATDSAGRVCAGQGGGLDAARTAALVATCRAR